MAAFKKHRQLFRRSLVSNEQLAKGISKILIKVRDAFVAFFDRIYNKLSPSRQKLSLIVFCLLATGSCLYQIIKAFSKDDKVENVSKKVPPRHFRKATVDLNLQRTIVTDAEYNRLQLFRTYMDSLRKSKNGDVIYDSILQARPGLMDSVQELHHLYESQLKKEK